MDGTGWNWAELDGTGWIFRHNSKSQFLNQTEIKWPASCVVLLVAFLVLVAFLALIAELLVGLFGDRHLVALLAVLDVGDSPATSGTRRHVAFNVRETYEALTKHGNGKKWERQGPIIFGLNKFD